MSARFRGLTATLALLCLIAPPSPPASAGAEKAPVLCGTPVASGPISEPPQIEMSSLPLDDLQEHELILRVVRSGDRFCYRYLLDGVEEHTAPIMRVHPGERFALRMVDELDGPASGATMSASALPACKPMPMPQMPAQHFAGYLNHVIESRSMTTKDIDVNMHFHGFQGPAVQENIFVSSLSTPEHACEFVLTIPLSQPPGTYFYHPHAHGMAEDEVAGGLSGMWIVESNVPALRSNDEHTVILRYRIPGVLDNNFIPHDGALFRAAAAHESAMTAAPPVAFDPFNPPPWPATIPLRAGPIQLVGRCGDRPAPELAVNEVTEPGDLRVPSGEPQLLRVLNATSDTPEYLRMRDALGNEHPLQIVARDGIPISGDSAHPLAQFQSAGEATLVPAGRLDILVNLHNGETLTLYGAPHCSAPLDEVKIPHDLLVIHGGPPLPVTTQFASSPVNAEQTPAMTLMRFVREHAASVRRRAITYSEYTIPNPSGHGVYGAYFITETSAEDFHERPFWPKYSRGMSAPAPDIVVKRGTVEEWYLFNTTMETHSFHIHQMSFVAEAGSEGPRTMDTVLVPFGSLLPNSKDPNYPLIKPSVVRVILDFRKVERGTFVFHCHMLFHEDRGMMGVIRVV